MAKKTAAKRTTSKKKTTKKAPARKPSKKKAGAKPSTSKKTTKKAPARKTSKKKASTTKKTTSKKSTTKKTTSKKTTTKKTTTKKAPARKPSKKTTTKKTTARKPSNKKTTTKKTTSKKAPASKPTTKKKTSSSSKSTTKKSTSKKTSAKDRWKGSYESDMTSSVSAASKLAAAAGLRPLHERQTTLAAAEDYKKLTKTPFKKRELDKFKEILRLKRAQVTGDVTDMETEALIGRGSGSLSKLPQHMADAGSDTYDQTLNLDLAAGQRKLLKEIDDALVRIENKTYGICELLGKPISKERLENTPWARYSIEGARRKEMLGY